MSQIKKINGINISINEAGSENKEAIILIHGRGYSKENMNPLFEYYRDRYHVISYDVRGHGESDKPKSYTLDDHCEDLKGITEFYKLKKPVVIGFSMGSYIALKTAEKYPNLFSKLVLIGTKGRGKTSSIQGVTNENKNVDPKEMMSIIRKKIFAPGVTDEQIAEFDKSIASNVKLTKDEQERIDRALTDFDLLKDAKKVNIPVLLMTGEYDGLNPVEKGKEVAESLPDAKFEIIPNAGHIAFFENSNKVFSLINSFLGGDAKQN